jgi:pimeloyl-ACP methyl ester carboxylesterase
MILLQDSGQGAPLVLICALMCDEQLYAGQYSILSRKFRVMIFRCEGEPSPAAAADDLVNKLNKMGIKRFILGGVSLGGYVAQEVVSRSPKVVEKLILIDTRAHGDSAEEAAKRRQMLSLLQQGQFEAVLSALLQVILSTESIADVALSSRVFKMARRLGASVFIEQLSLLLNRRDTRADIAAFDGKVLCICGAADALTPPALMREMAESAPSGQLRIVPGNCGHLSPMESPEIVNKHLLEFLGM